MFVTVLGIATENDVDVLEIDALGMSSTLVLLLSSKTNRTLSAVVSIEVGITTVVFSLKNSLTLEESPLVIPENVPGVTLKDGGTADPRRSSYRAKS